MDILERRDAFTRMRRTLRKWRPRPNTGSLTKDGKATNDTVPSVTTLVKGLSTGVRASRLAAAE